MLLFQEASEAVLPTPVYFVGLLAGLAVYGFRRKDSWCGRWRFALLLLLTWSYVGTLPILANALLRDLETRVPVPVSVAPDPNAWIVVLASGYWRRSGETFVAIADEAGWARTHAAVQLWRQTGGQLVFAGGPTPDGRESVAQHMAAVAIQMGVAPSAVRVENQSRNTYQNLQFVRALRGAETLSGWLVTSAVHMPRALAVADSLALSLKPYPCDQRAPDTLGWRAWFPNGGALRLYTTVLHEYLGMIAYRVRGQAS